MATKKKSSKKKRTPIKDLDENKPLTEKQKMMVHEYLLWGNKARAYQMAFETEAQGTSLYVVAWKEFQKPNVKKYTQELQDKAVYDHLVTKETLARELDQARGLALSLGHSAAAVSASTAKAKLYGQMTDKVEQKVTGPDGGPLVTAPIRIEVVQVEKTDDSNED